MSDVRTDLLSQILYEADAYKKFEDIEKLVEPGGSLAMVPIQPLYLSLQATSKDQVAAILPRLSVEQRQALRDIDLWKKDEVDPESAVYWLEVYTKCQNEEVLLEYLTSEDFLLTFKNQFSISTFDVEDPMYPDSDNYFLTEDNLLLIEYSENFNFVPELKNCIRLLYSVMGVENAYAFLFKMVVDSYQVMEEAAYQEKTERLRDFGFVDYFEALGTISPLSSLKQIDDFIKNKKASTGSLDSISLNQTLHSSSLTPYQVGLGDIKEALSEIKDEKRSQFLHFNFIRLVNARITAEDSLKNGSVAMGKVGLQTKTRLELGFDYVKEKLASNDKSKIFSLFDFVDLYKVGHSLIELNKKKIKKALGDTPFEKDDFNYFLGMYWNSFIDNSHEEVTKYKFDGSSSPLEINSVESFSLWSRATQAFCEVLPFVQQFFLSINKLKSEGLINDQFYLNYEVDNIDFEAIMISSFVNFSAGHYENESHGKMGITTKELVNFYHSYFKKVGEEYLIKGEEDPILREKIQGFSEKFGLDTVLDFDKYIYQILLEQLNGYEIDGMSDEEFKHIGGPILLNYRGH